MEKWRNWAFGAIALAFSVFQLYVGTVGRLDPFLLRIIHLYFVLVLAFLFVPQRKEGAGSLDPAPQPGLKKLISKHIDYAFLALVILTGVYLIAMWPVLGKRFPLVSPLPANGIIFGLIFAVILLEAVRRFMGIELVVVTLVIALYVLFGKYTPGIFHHLGYSLENVIDVIYMSTDGTFGETLGMSANYLFLYVLFGSFLLRSGLGEMIVELGKGLAGNLQGGPAKIGIVSSAGIGMISGSAVANVLTAGTFTIPLMKKMGYPPYLAGAIEAVASTGGVIMPPVMGAVAFIMAEYLGMPYARVIAYAAFPGFLYYLALYCAVHFEAGKRRLPVIPKNELPSIVAILKKDWYLLIPVVLLLAVILKGYSPGRAALVAIYATIALLLLNPRKSFLARISDVISALRHGAKDGLMVVLALAVAGFIEGLISITGLGLKLSAVLVQIAPNAFTLLALAAGTLFILGLALPSMVTYITAVPILVPPLVKYGLDPVAVHLFLIYWATLSMITPPTGASFYAAAGVAGAPVMKVGWASSRIAAPIYLLTFMFGMEPALLFRGGNLGATLFFSVPAVLGVIGISAANSGYMLSDLKAWERLLLVLSGVALLFAKPVFLLAGIVAFAVVFLRQVVQRGKIPPGSKNLPLGTV